MLQGVCKAMPLIVDSNNKVQCIEGTHVIVLAI